MRQAVIDYLGTFKLTPFRLSDELPFSNSGVEMYLKNSKVLYVDQSQKITNNAYSTFSGLLIDEETTTVRVYLSTDAKQLPSTYEALINNIRAGRTALQPGYHKVECDVTTSYENDLMLTEIEFRFTKLI